MAFIKANVRLFTSEGYTRHSQGLSLSEEHYEYDETMFNLNHIVYIGPTDYPGCVEISLSNNINFTIKATISEMKEVVSQAQKKGIECLNIQLLGSN